jgi:hypothetical protein
MDKKGDLTSTQIITIIVLIVSFGIILIFFIGLGLKGETEKERCRNSVVLRGINFGGVVKLNCKTEDVCISMGENCKEAIADTKTVKVKSEEELFETLSNLLYDCWWQMGEGKINYLPTGEDGPYCAICSRIHFDNKIQAYFDRGMSLPNFYSYLRGKPTPDGKTNMLFYLYGLNDVNAALKSLQGPDAQKNDDFIGTATGKLNLAYPNGYVIFTSITKKGWGLWTIVGTSLAIGGGVVLTLIAPPVGLSVAAAAAWGGGVAAGSGLVIGSVTGGNSYMHPVLVIWNEKALENLECSEYASLD